MILVFVTNTHASGIVVDLIKYFCLNSGHRNCPIHMNKVSVFIIN